nr:hypothetical protein [Planctomycetota bacterium]
MTSLAVEFPARDQVRLITTAVDGSPLKPLEALIVSETSVISSGTELARLRGIEAGVTFPCRPGYGTVGRIAELGPDMGGFAIGQRVFFAGRHAARQRFMHGADHEWGWLFPVPDAIDPIDAAIGCMARIALTAPQVTELQPGDTVAVFGLGMVGLIAAQLYRIRGARVIGVDPVASRCALARRLGIGETIDVAPGEQVAALRALTA